MSNYTITTNFGAKDSLPSGNAGKVIKGSEFTTEFTNIQTAIATKADTAGDTFTGAVTFDAAVTLNSTATITGDLTVDTDTLFVDVSADKVGIGTSSPLADLHVSNGTNSDSTPVEFMIGGSANSVRTGSIVKGTTSGAYDLTLQTSNHASQNQPLIIKLSDATEAMRINSSGNVGIGTNSPATSLHVLNASDTQIRLSQTGEGSYDLGVIDGDKFAINRDGLTNEFVMSAGKVGIGTASPSSQLHVSSTDSVSITQTHTDGNTVSFKQSGTGGDVEWRNGNGEALILTGSQTRMTVDSSGNVGIGTDNPAKKLHVLGGDVRIESTFPRLYLTDTNNNSDYSIINNNGQFGIYDDTNATYRMVINNTTGKVGIGTNSPSAKATIEDGDFARLDLNLSNATGTTIADVRGLVEGTEKWRIGKTASASDDFTINVGSTERMRIDSSGNVGIGTASPSNPLHLKAATNIPALIETTHSNGNSRLRFSTASGTDWSIGANSNGNFTLFDAVNSNNCFTAEAGAGANTLVIDSNSRVGIGTEAPASTLHVQAAGSALQINNANEDTYMKVCGTRAMFGYRAVDGHAIVQGAGSKGIAFCVNNATFGSGEAMRIRSSGKLVIGKTDESVINTVGIEAHPTGLLVATRDDNIPLIANRKTSDGVVAQFRKDNTVVGAIGTIGNEIYIESGDVGLQFDASGNDIVPYGGGYRDATIDLGSSANRFKDLYLSGGAYLGGTGSANKLDDYEEGTWTMSVSDSASTPNVSSSTNTGCRYIKVGDLVTIEGHLVDINKGSLGSTSLKITGFPFTIKSTGSTRPHGAIQVNHFSGAQVERGLYVQGQANGTHALIKSNVTDTGASSVSASALDSGNTSDIFFSLTYIAE